MGGGNKKKHKKPFRKEKARSFPTIVICSGGMEHLLYRRNNVITFAIFVIYVVQRRPSHIRMYCVALSGIVRRRMPNARSLKKGAATPIQFTYYNHFPYLVLSREDKD